MRVSLRSIVDTIKLLLDDIKTINDTDKKNKEENVQHSEAYKMC